MRPVLVRVCAYVNPPQWDPLQWPLSVALVERNEKRGPPPVPSCQRACVRACMLHASAVSSSLPPYRDLLYVPFFLFPGRFGRLRIYFRYCFVPRDVYSALCVRQGIYPLICIYLSVDSAGDSITATRTCDLICINTITPRIKTRRNFLRTCLSPPLFLFLFLLSLSISILHARLQRNATRCLFLFLSFYRSPNQPHARLTARPRSFSSRGLLRSTTAQTRTREIEG